jgi:PAS domain S-box-containing protein
VTVHRIDELRQALSKGEIVPYFQPIIDLRSRAVLGFEVLARLKRPGVEATLPPNMIRIAESANLIGQVTEALLAQTANLAASLSKQLTYAVNISPRQFCAPSFAEHLLSVLTDIGLDPEQLVVEITESALLDNFELALSTSKRLKSYGIQLALDDFGTGYSSMKHLQALPFDELKVDGSFVNSMTDLRASRKIVAAIAGLSHSLGLTTVAEGIEQKEQAEMLLYLGCSRGQGWLFGHPFPASDVPAFLARPEGVEPFVQTPMSSVAITIGTTLEVLPAQRLSQLQAIYDGAPVGLCFLDRSLRYMSLNKHLAEANRQPIESHLGRTVAEVIPETYADVEPYLQLALRGESVNSLEVTKTWPEHPDQKKTYLVTYEPARDEVGEVVGVSVVLVDITMRKRAENALRSSIDHYWRAAGSGPQVPWTADPDGKILDISPRWEIVTGLSQEDAIGFHWKDAIHPEDRERVTHWFDRALHSGSPLDILSRLCRRDGETIWIRLTAAARFAPDGTVVRWYGTMEEIDARRKEDDFQA